MHSLHYSLVTSVLVLILMAGGPAGQAQQGLGPGDFVLTEREAILLDVPELVAPGVVEGALWSSSGKYVLAERNKIDAAETLAGRPAMESALVLWSKETRQSREVWKSRVLGQPVRGFDWLRGTDIALAVVQQPPAAGRPLGAASAGAPMPPDEPETWLLRLDARRAAVRLSARVPDGTQLIPSPSRPVAALVNNRLLRLVSADGSVRDLTPLVEGLNLNIPSWSSDGARLRFFGAQFRHVIDQKEGQPRSRQGWYSLDATTGKLSGPLPDPERETPPAPAATSLRLRSGKSALREQKVTRELRPLWLESTAQGEQSLALVSADSPHGVISPRNDAVLYVSEGAAWVRPLVRVDKAVYLAVRARAEQVRLISNMKQVGLAMHRYAVDNDEKLPAAGSDLETLLMPYLCDTGMLQGFQYVFPGGDLADVKEPAETLLGYVPAMGGRIMVYVDGHVKFTPE
jgi:hypothetical protein